MRRIVCMVLGLLLLAGCGVVDMVESETTMEETTIAVPSNAEGGQRFPLAASLPEDDIYLYSVNGYNNQGGMVLFQEGCETYFAGWDGIARYNEYPVLTYRDFDGDGEREIGVITGIIAGGSGPSLSSLHILKVHEDNTYMQMKFSYTEYAMTPEDITAYFEEKMTWKRGKEPNTLELKIDDQAFIAYLYPDETWKEEGGVVVDHRIHFYFREDGSIEFSGMANLWYTSSERSHGIGYFNADVTFDGEQFHLTNIDFEPFQEN